MSQSDIAWVTVYDLAADHRYIESVQQATLTRPGYGLEPDPALFGSEEWWGALGSDRLPIHLVEGTICRVWWGSMGDWPMFALQNSEGVESEWTREGDRTRYAEGLRARVHYVLQRLKENSQMAAMGEGFRTQKVTVKIEVEASDRRSAGAVPGPFGNPSE